MRKNKSFALLIDGDSILSKYLKLIFDEVSKEGVLNHKRIYADWTKPAFASWKRELLKYSITPIQQYSYTSGKNATDSAMIIDAMDILYSKKVDGFCLVSSESDFTRLATRLRESGNYVLGMGNKNTPQAFVVACNRFVYLEALARSLKPLDTYVTKLTIIKKAIKEIVDDNSDEEGWTPLSDIGNTLLKRYPDFDVRNYGFQKLYPFIESLGVFKIKFVNAGENIKLIFIRNPN